MSNRWLLATVVLLTGCADEWRGAEPVDDRPRVSAPGADPFPAAAMAGPRAIVVWGAILRDGFTTTPGTWARWNDGTTWSEFVNLGARTQRPALVASSNGTALALVADGVTHFNGTTWSRPTAVDLGRNPQLAMDGAGNALAVGTLGAELFVTEFSPGTGWRPGIPLATAGSGPLVAMSESGHAIVVWFDGVDIRARLRSPSGLWSTQRTVDTGCSPVAVRMFGVDRSVVVGSCGRSLRLLRSGAAGGFFEAGETPQGLDTRLAINSLGGALVATATGSGSNVLNISHAAPDMPLTAPLVVTTSLILPTIGATFGVALDSAERGHVIYTELEGLGSRLKGRELDGNSLTLTPPVVLDRGTGSAYYPTLSGTGDGSAIVAWNQSGANPEEIWANLFR